MPDLSRLSQIRVGCLRDRVPFPGAWIRVSLGVTRKNEFSTFAWPANDNGIVSLTGAFLLERAREIAGHFPMDHGSPCTELDGTITVEPVALDHVDRALAGYELWGPAVFPDGYIEELRDLRTRLVDAPSGELMVMVVAVEPEGEFTVTALPRRVPSR